MSSQNQQNVTVTACPPGCGNICNRVFEDSLGLGYRVYCKCPICHTDNTGSRRRKVVVAEGEPQLHEQLQPIHAHQPIATEVVVAILTEFIDNNYKSPSHKSYF